MRPTTLSLAAAVLFLPGCIELPPLPACIDFSLPTEGCSDPCKTYCDYVVEQCPGEFNSVPACEADCRFELPESVKTGEPGEEGRDTLACRITQARNGNCDSAGLAPSLECPTINCVEYCDVMATNCPDEYQNDNRLCLGTCSNFPLRNTATSSNSVSCRLEQAERAGQLPAGPDRENACLAAGVTGGTVCGDECDFYCTAVERNCVGERRLYSDRTTCLEVCRLFPLGSEADFNVDGPDGDTAGCRLWHAVAAGDSDEAAGIHCPHAGVYNPMFCGSRFPMGTAPRTWPCSTYCTLVLRNCPGTYPDRNACQAACASFPELDGLGEMEQPDIYPLTGLTCPSGG